jgi:hypothetical protein
MRICVIDPGIRNFAITIEEFDLQLAKDAKNLKDIYTNGSIIHLELVDLAIGYQAKKVGIYTITNLTQYLESILPLLSLCDAFVVEKQLKLNPSAQWIEHHCYAFFSMHFHDFKAITPFQAKIKYSELNYKGNRKKNSRKNWAASLSINILTDRNDFNSLLLISKSKKKDDLGDVVIMAQAFKSCIFLKKKFNEQI